MCTVGSGIKRISPSPDWTDLTDRAGVLDPVWTQTIQFSLKESLTDRLIACY